MKTMAEEARDMGRSFFRGHPIVWQGDNDTGRWVYEDTGEPLPEAGGTERPCTICGAQMALGTEDACLGRLPGVDNACCGHGHPEIAYIRFTNGVVIRDFRVETPNDQVQP